MTANTRSGKKTGSQRRRGKPAKNRKPRTPETAHENPPVFQGWATTDTDEIERHRWRGATEIDHVESLEPDRPYFRAFAVRSASGRRYVVEIRDLERRENSCDCLD